MGGLRLRGRGRGRRSESFVVPERRHRCDGRVGQDSPFVRSETERQVEVFYVPSIRVCVETRRNKRRSKKRKWHGQGCYK